MACVVPGPWSEIARSLSNPIETKEPGETRKTLLVALKPEPSPKAIKVPVE